jgi:hypothetical protein
MTAPRSRLELLGVGFTAFGRPHRRWTPGSARSTHCGASPTTRPGTGPLVAYVRNHDFCAARQSAPQCSGASVQQRAGHPIVRMPTDVHAALTTAPALGNGDLTDFTQTRFPRADFRQNAQLSRADLRGVFGKTPDEVKAVAETDSETEFGDQAVLDPSVAACDDVG